MAEPFVKRDTFLPFSRPTIRQVEIDEVVDTLRSGWLTTGPKSRALREGFRRLRRRAARRWPCPRPPPGSTSA